MTAETLNTETPLAVETPNDNTAPHSPEINNQKQKETSSPTLPQIIETQPSPQQNSQEQAPPVRIRMRQKTPLTAKNDPNSTPEPPVNDNTPPTINGINASTAALLHRTMESLSELPPELEESNEEIRKLDTQLDHLNEYMDKIEERLKAHQEKMLETLKTQKEEREKRRRSFHERMQLNKQEDEEFQQQLSAILNRVDISRKRQSVYDTISGMEIPKTNGSS